MRELDETDTEAENQPIPNPKSMREYVEKRLLGAQKKVARDKLPPAEPPSASKRPASKNNQTVWGRKKTVIGRPITES